MLQALIHVLAELGEMGNKVFSLGKKVVYGTTWLQC